MNQHTSAQTPAGTFDEIDVDRAADLPADVLLLDVREYDEWMTGHAPSATHIPMSQLPQRIGELGGSHRIVCVCRSGNRSAQVAHWLARQGFHVSNMTGGMKAWALHGHPVVNHAGNPGTVL